MIRFEPDTLLDALVRPIGMAVPAGGVYAEILAPDFRFVFVLALVLAWIAWRVRLRAPAVTRTLALLACVALSFVPWLVTSGNGRYFMPMLLIVGPLCIAMLHHLPVRQGARLGAAAFMLLAQVGLLHEVQPWRSWGLAPWRDGPAFGIDVPKDLRETPATYISLSGISYSLIAPSFHPDSRWMNLSSQAGRPDQADDLRRVHRLLDASPVIYGVVPSANRNANERDMPDDQADALDLGIADFGLRIRRSSCRVVASVGLTAVGAAPDQQISDKDPRGFLVCRLDRLAGKAAPAKPQIPAEVEAALDAVEKQCPRLFPPGNATTTVLPVGYRRFYSESDMRLYAMDDGRVMFKYIRALNMVQVGTKASVVAPGFHMDCNIKGRAGLPWEREI
ncbi:hypothetical protein HHL11_02990 [Ramlibacter sp. G-1-2-2]|uniref:Uncharacterized protein n=1 Tax=Ramlibacter agri TaxID=2728837 RepID=A0A848GZ89_9BURK|nr:hypothetical protein [Ramlibacter agri]NML42701.1 hypothetical protein [Ramlibacter agri]